MARPIKSAILVEGDTIVNVANFREGSTLPRGWVWPEPDDAVGIGAVKKNGGNFTLPEVVQKTTALEKESEVRAKLSRTDWMVHRALTGGKPLPVAVLEERDALYELLDAGFTDD